LRFDGGRGASAPSGSALRALATLNSRPPPDLPWGTAPSAAAAASPPRGAMRVVGYDVVRKQRGTGCVPEQTIQVKPAVRSRWNVYHDGPGEAWSGFERADSAAHPRLREGDSRPPPDLPRGLERRSTKRPASDNAIRKLATNIIVAGRHKLKAHSIRRSNSAVLGRSLLLNYGDPYLAVIVFGGNVARVIHL
jgi:hypothetical protein